MTFTQDFTVPNSRCIYGGIFFGIYRRGDQTIIQIRGRQWHKQRDENFFSSHGCTYRQCRQFQKKYGHSNCPQEGCLTKQRYQKLVFNN